MRYFIENETKTHTHTHTHTCTPMMCVCPYVPCGCTYTLTAFVEKSKGDQLLNHLLFFDYTVISNGKISLWKHRKCPKSAQTNIRGGRSNVFSTEVGSLLLNKGT